jgi:hypothetical protein
MVADFIIKTGDMIRITIFPPAIVPLLLSPMPLIGTSTNLMVSNMPVCLEGDELPISLRIPLPYTAPPFVTPGMGLVSVTLTPMNKSLQSKNKKAILIKGTPFIAEFQVTVPAMQPMVPSPIPDPVLKKPGIAEFITTNVTVKAG